MKNNDRHEEAMELSRSGVARSDRSRSSWGSLLMSMVNVKGKCTDDRKCIKKENHEGACWPTSN